MNRLLLVCLLFPFLASAQVPDWQWARNSPLYFNGMRQIHSVDSSGNIIMIGDYDTPTLTLGGFTLTNNGEVDLYIVKYSNSGQVLWAQGIGCPGHDSALAVTTDVNGNFYVVGLFTDVLTIGGQTLTHNGWGTYIAKFNAQGDVVWVKTNAEEIGGFTVSAIKADAQGNVYFTGGYSLPELTFGSLSLTYDNYSSTNGPRVYTAKLDSNGNTVWLRGSHSAVTNVYGSSGLDLSIGTNGHVAVTGYFNEPIQNFGSIALTKSASYDYNCNMFILEYDAQGNALWAKNAGSVYENLTRGQSTVVDAAGNVYVTGYFSNDISFDNIAISTISGSSQYLVKFSATGQAQWAKTVFTETCGMIPYSLDQDAAGNIYLAGFTQCPSLVFQNNLVLNMLGEGGLYVVKFNPAGNALWAKRSGSTNINNFANIDVVSANEIYVSGTFSSPTLTLGAHTLIKSDMNYNLFLAKLYYEPLDTDEF